MYVQITREFVAEVWYFESDECHSHDRTFYPSTIYDVGEVAPMEEGFTVIEFRGIGVAEVPDDCWKFYDGIMLRLRVGYASSN